MIRGTAEYKLFLIGNKGLKGVGIFLANISVDKVIDISRVTDRMIVIKIFCSRDYCFVDLSLCPTMLFTQQPES